MTRKNLGVTLFTACLFFSLLSQAQDQSPQKYIVELKLYVDTLEFSSSTNIISQNKVDKLFFQYDDPQEVVGVKAYVQENDNIKKLRLRPSSDFEVVDSIVNYNNEYYGFKVRFKNLNEASLLNFTFLTTVKNLEKEVIQSFELLPVTATTAELSREEEELFIGEEKIITLLSNNPGNIRPENNWVSIDGYEYRITKNEGDVRLHILPYKYGNIAVAPIVKVGNPRLKDNNQLDYNIEIEPITFAVKKSGLAFLSINHKEITFDKTGREEGIEVQLDYNRQVKLQKTYRVEAQEEAGGALMAELFTRSRLNNGKILAIIRPFNLHRQSDGYLYIKDGDNASFITNFNISPPVEVESVMIRHEAMDWTGNLVVKPGETVEVKVAGKALHKANFHFKNAIELSHDTLTEYVEQKFFTIQIPVNITTKRVELFNHSSPTGWSLKVEEYQRPKRFDFVYLDYGDGKKQASKIIAPVLYDKTIQDLIISFDPNKIDNPQQLYGKQHIKIEIKVISSNNQLIDQREIEDIVICPGTNSPRHSFYYDDKCNGHPINLNSLLRKKAYELNGWDRIEVSISHLRDKYDGNTVTQRIELYYQRHYHFDINVSFPAGLLINKQGEKGYGNFGGISMAMIAQFSFYHPTKINKLKPYRAGVGFIALDAFNFTESSSNNRDLSVVVLGSLYPVNTRGKFSFPLYAGGGYLLGQKKLFFLLGPGIHLKL